MEAHTKLNGSHFLGSLLVARLIGWLPQSWVILLVALVVLVATNLLMGDILVHEVHLTHKKGGTGSITVTG